MSDRTLDRPARALACLAAGLAVLVLLAWSFDQDALALLDPGAATMKVNTALCCLALAVTVWTRRGPLVAGLTGVVAAVALATLLEYLLGIDLGIDEVLVQDLQTVGVAAAGRMAPGTAVSLLLLAASRWALQGGARKVADVLLTLPLAVGSVALLGYLFRVEQFHTFVQYSTVSLLVAIAVVLLSLAIACSVPGGVAWWLAEDPGAGATLVRHILPVAVIVLPLLGVLPALGVEQGVIDERFGIAVLVAAAATVLVAAAAVAAARLDRIDRERLRAERGLLEANEQLRERRDLEWRRAEELSHDLSEERARFQRAISKIDDSIWTVEVMADGRIRSEFSSGDASGLFGGERPGGDPRSRVFHELVHPDDRPLLEDFEDKIRRAEPAEVECRVVGYDGEVRWAWVRGTPRRERRQLFFDGISTNVTDRRQLAERRERLLALEQEQVRQLTQLNQLRDELLAVTGHELRTPLAVILGYAELLLQDTDLTDVQRRHLETVANRARQIGLLVEDIFDLAKFSAGLATIDAHPVSLDEAVARAVEEHRTAADDAGITVDVDVEPVTVSADPARLRQILDNLISNAIKYSLPGGHVLVTAQCKGDTASIAVTDGGIGIPDGELEHVFDRMYRATTAKDHDIQGTGLGLSVAKALVEAHQGTISVASRPEGGTRFTVAIPVQRRAPDPAPAVG